MLRRLLASFLFLFAVAARGLCQLPAASFSEKDIISPAPGTWGNRQPLVVNVPDGCEVYYSISGSDPLLFGFAYDGPSLIDQEGDVHLKLTAVDRAGRRSDFSVSYCVKSLSQLDSGGSWSEAQKKFIQTISKNPVRKYTAGSVFSIPEGFSYAASAIYPDGDARFFKGGLLSLGTENNVVRLVPFVVTDGVDLFRFIVRTVPAKDGRGDAAQMPFIFSDWDTVVPQDPACLYRIDDGEWQGKLSYLRVDRSETHVLFWKAADQADDAGASSMVLYPRPSLECTRRQDGSLCLSLSLPPPYLKGYRLGRPESPSSGTLKAASPAPGLYESLVMDAFLGEDLAGTFTSGVYLDGVYQGELSTAYDLDRLPPDPPVIVPAEISERAFTDGREVRLLAEEGARLFYAVSAGVPLERLDEDGKPSGLEKLPLGDFQELSGDRLVLPTVGGSTAFYRVAAYAVDASGNAGERSERPVIVGGRNVYLRAGSVDAPAGEGNGSYDSPFTSFEHAVSVINANDGLVLHIAGDVRVHGSIVLSGSCVLDGSRGSLTFAKDAGLSIENASVRFKDCPIMGEDGMALPAFITVLGGRVSFEGCDVSASFEKDGKLVDLNSSVLSAQSSSFSAYSSSFASVVSSQGSQVEIRSSSCAASSYTAVAFCMAESDLLLEDSIASVSCYTGRIADLAGGSFALQGNLLSGALSSGGVMGRIPAVRAGGGARELSVGSNRIRGFERW